MLKFVFEESALSVAGKYSCHVRWMTVIAVVMVGALLCSGCTRKKDTEYLVRVRDRSLTVFDYNRAVEAAAEEAFAGERDVGADELIELRVRILNQLTEEMLISVFAADNNIQITPEELIKAVDAIKADYPDNTFEETLLENAVSFSSWKDKLATRLLVEKVIGSELIDTVQITSGDIEQYYKDNFPQGLPAESDADATHRKVVKHLRLMKAETAYKEWIERLRQTYSVDINKSAWESLKELPHA
ncbi:MAG: hypothetical protein VR64_05880 [Desulfatitalea sp. BRH_c12]|nr:MAG: hypothetical protein VR64_05880 [Desulfatitalea sp. BRH_c12]